MVEGDTIDAVWSNGAPPGRERYEIRLARLRCPRPGPRGRARGDAARQRPTMPSTQTRGRMSERTARLFGASRSAVLISASSAWLEDFLNSVLGREEQAANQLHAERGPGGVPGACSNRPRRMRRRSGTSGEPRLRVVMIAGEKHKSLLRRRHRPTRRRIVATECRAASF